MTFREEFPDFDPATMPAIPAGWNDISWHNDACPSFDAGRGRSVWVNFADKNLREWGPEHPRFTVQLTDADGLNVRTLLETDDWNEVLDLIANEGNHDL